MPPIGQSSAIGPDELKSLPLGRRFAAVPSWLLSVLLHGALVVALAATLPGLRGGIVGDPAGDYRKIGVYVGQSGDGQEGSAAAAGKTTDVKPSLAANSSAEPGQKVAEAAVGEIPPPFKLRPIVAADTVADRSNHSAKTLPHSSAVANTAASNASGRSGTSIASSSTGALGRGPGTGPRGSRGSTQFFGIFDAGGRFVYVIDCSGSMFAHNALQAAKNELLSSLGTLKRSQEFQVIFYNIEQRWMKEPGKTSLQFFPATSQNRRLAEQFADEIQADSGTDHLPALKLAIGLHPDVIYFLTDGETGLGPTELEALRRLNEGRSHIHCIQFVTKHDSGLTAADDFMQKLAAENGGDFICRDVGRFVRRR